MLTEGAKGMKGAIQKAEEIVASNPEKYLLLQQFSNPANPEIHEKTTGPEIWEDTDGQVDVFIAGVGTGGTLTGVSRYIKGTKGKTDLISVAVEPTDSPVIARALAGEEIKLARIKFRVLALVLSRRTSISSWSIKSLASPMKKPFLPRVV